jgi:hypothetical protein
LAEREALVQAREEKLAMSDLGGVGEIGGGRGGEGSLALLSKKSVGGRAVDGESVGDRAVEGAEAEVLVFEDTFEELDMEIWAHDITMAGGGNWEFQYYTNNRSNSFVEEGVLYLQPTLTEETIGEANMMGEKPFRFDMWGMWPSDACTSNAFYGCERISDAGAQLVINPVQSARLRTTGTFTFQYGRLEVEAKLPRGDWLWPAIWLLPEKNVYGQWPASGEIDVMESRGNKPGYVKGGYDSFGSCMHWGPYFALDKYDMTCESFTLPEGKGTFNDDFHVFGMVWNEQGLYTYLDREDQKVLEVKFDRPFFERGDFSDVPGTGNPWIGRPNAAPFDQPFYLVLNVAVGGLSNFFEDGEDGKPWTNTGKGAPYLFAKAKDEWYPSWAGRDSALQVKSVRVWQKPGQGKASVLGEKPREGAGVGGAGNDAVLAPSSAPRKGHDSHQNNDSHQNKPLSGVDTSKRRGSTGGWIFGSLLVLVLAGAGVAYGVYLRMGGFPGTGNRVGGGRGGQVYTSVVGGSEAPYQATSYSDATRSTHRI